MDAAHFQADRFEYRDFAVDAGVIAADVNRHLEFGNEIRFITEADLRSVDLIRNGLGTTHDFDNRRLHLGRPSRLDEFVTGVGTRTEDGRDYNQNESGPVHVRVLSAWM